MLLAHACHESHALSNVSLFSFTVTSYNNVLDANSDSDDEDKLHIVEEESVTDAADGEGDLPEDDLPTDQTVLAEGSESVKQSCWDDEGTVYCFSCLF